LYAVDTDCEGLRMGLSALLDPGVSTWALGATTMTAADPSDEGRARLAKERWIYAGGRSGGE